MTKLLSNSTKPSKRLWLPLLGLATTVLILTTAARKEPRIFLGDFETGNFSGWEPELCCKHSGEIISSPTRAGNYAAKFAVNKSDPLVERGKRAELKRYAAGRMGSEIWYGFSIYLPKDWVEDTAPEIVAQWHDRPDLWFGEPFRNPSLALTINGNNWGISNTWDSKVVTGKNNAAGKEQLWSGVISKGVWTDWVFHVKWSHQSDGIVEVWKDGIRIVNKRGSVTYNDLLAPFFKVGLYKFPWKSGKVPSITNKRIIYYDEIRIGNANASYEDVVPKP